ncbi:MAG: hypothetical protein CMB99_06655 [Flavobacteriaceae bacterium]|nr:hypothetical protein [Flavobacteriaceae bacterium]|tara:strand:- start:101324 stop:101848 length:525 start_codon:yes stop_codon:yes gene_type:complete
MKLAFAQSSDIPRILEIMNYWLNVPSKESGFLFGVPFTEEELQLMIEEKAVFVARIEDEIQGYFLFDEVTRNETTQMNKNLLDKVYSKSLFGFEKEALIPRGSVAVAPDCQENISKDLMDFFKENYQGSKKAMFSIVAIDNPNIHVHIRNGVEVVLQDEKYYYVLYRLGKTKNK